MVKDHVPALWLPQPPMSSSSVKEYPSASMINLTLLYAQRSR